ncbi:MAG TPA: protein-glutamate O-methyltransferase [Acidiphilium sp.]|jgi:chemotaxis protein methyltransferase CheR|uniref:CheR family methyltransferase n=1 Tax=unclassified Acidiphilium TaxID=2617493 RepID=UPI000BC8164E|nr:MULTISPECIES: protein-glutamate O-methyltransferase [unclassified Acidiphilium]OYV55142.1 MAG: chemotaxis protein [Acidiphilium sp. 20-67-58]HQT61605.1 protein-glutamate O-methyltransferase [Acidiphilium sp.]HQU12312.1 protein-glutamate O-methyltransferase [Acidiphilium sp.]
MSLRPRPRRDNEGLIEGAEYVLTREDFRTIARIMHEEAGIALPEAKATLVYSRLAKRIRTLGLESFAEYCELVESKAGSAERQEMLGALTTNVTRFFREPHHFDHLRTRILPPLLAQARSGGRVRLWSAACSSGQEPYSIALTVLGLLPEAPRYDIRILATDIDRTMLATGRAGLYDAGEIAAVPPDLRERWFEPANNNSPKFRIAEAARSLVAFRSLNLIGNWPMRGRFNAVFCRNVAIYFDDETQKQVWARMVPLLEEGGALYIGHSERVSGPAEASLRSDGITTYRLMAPRGTKG